MELKNSYFSLPDDEEDFCQKTPLTWEKEVVEKKIDMFLLFEGEFCLEFANMYLLKNAIKINEIADAKTNLYKLPGDKNIVFCTTACKELELFGEATYLLEDYINASTLVVAIQSAPIVSYRTKSEELQTVIRSIYTQNCTFRLDIPELKPPNYVAGLSAGVHNICHFNEHEAAVYMYYLSRDHYGLDKDKAKKLIDIMKVYSVPVSGEAATKTKNFSNLYT